MPTSQKTTSEREPEGRDPYEAYFRHERRYYRAQAAVLIGSLFLMVVLLGGLLLWRVSADMQVTAINKETGLPSY
jgi:hypothetical protein